MSFNAKVRDELEGSGGVGEKQLHAGVFGDGDCLADGRGEFVGEFELF